MQPLDMRDVELGYGIRGIRGIRGNHGRQVVALAANRLEQVAL